MKVPYKLSCNMHNITGETYRIFLYTAEYNFTHGYITEKNI